MDNLIARVATAAGITPDIARQAVSLVVDFVKREMGNRDWRFIDGSGAEFTPEMISSLILRRLKEDAETFREWWRARETGR